MILATGTRRVALAGNPNTGKTTLFNRLTGSRARVGNYPGVTVERLSGRLRLPGRDDAELVDVPGTYSLAARSEEERIALDALAGLGLHEPCGAVVAVVDATQVERNLYLVLQVLALGVPLVVALNMVDVAERRGRDVDADTLARALGVPVVPVVALHGEGVDALRAEVARVLEEPERGRSRLGWRPEDPVLAADVEAVGQAVPEAWHRGSGERRAALAAWALLSIDPEDELEGVPPELRARVEERRKLAEAAGRDVEEEIIRGHYDWIDARAPGFLHQSPESLSWTDRIDRVLLHPLLGFGFFLVLMTTIFQALFAWADPMIGLVESGVGLLGAGMAALLPAGLVEDLLVDGVVAGVGAVLVFLPQILLLFFFLEMLEDTGYMARVAVLMDRVMKSIGLHGRAFVPMLSGYACAVPAILATRTIERRRDRLLTMAVVPLMTCSARLPVYGLLIAAIVPVGAGHGPFTQGMLLVGMYLFSTVVALLAAFVLGRTVLKGPRMPLLIEMPPYRVPHWPTVVRTMWRRSAVFLREAGSIILVCSIAMWALLSFPHDGGVEREYAARREALVAALAGASPATRDEHLAALDSAETGAQVRASFGGRLGRAMEPVIEPLGYDWKIGVGLIGAFAAREVFVSTMAVVYGLDDESDESSPALREEVRSQRRPDGSPVYTPLVCLSLMVFFALACQCMSTLAVVRRETGGWRWPAFLFAYMTALAWVASFLLYQGGRLLGFS